LNQPAKGKALRQEAEGELVVWVSHRNGDCLKKSFLFSVRFLRAPERLRFSLEA
jgi:hypothetical protein